MHAENALKAEEHFRNTTIKVKGVEYYEVFVFTGVSDYV